MAEGTRLEAAVYSPIVSPNAMGSPMRSARELQGTLSTGDIATLQLMLPFALEPTVRDWLGTTTLLGAGFALPMPLTGVVPDPDFYAVQFFSPARLLDEVALFEPSVHLVRDGLLPIAGCGRGGRDVYLLRAKAGASDVAALVRYDALRRGIQELGVGLSEALARGVALSSSTLRRRLPGSVISARRKPATHSPGPRSAPRATAQSRTLSLFS